MAFSLLETPRDEILIGSGGTISSYAKALWEPTKRSAVWMSEVSRIEFFPWPRRIQENFSVASGEDYSTKVQTQGC